MSGSRWQLEPAEVAALVSGTHGDPFARLGVHKAGSAYVARAVIPDAETVEAFSLDGTALGALEPGQGPGYFEGKVALKEQRPVFYEARNSGGQWTIVDPYSFGPVLGPMDDYYVAEGTHLRLYDKLGAHPISGEQPWLCGSGVLSPQPPQQYSRRSIVDSQLPLRSRWSFRGLLKLNWTLRRTQMSRK